MGKKGKGSKKKDDEKKKKKKKKKDNTHTSKEPSVMVPNQTTAVPMKKFMVLYMASGPEFEGNATARMLLSLKSIRSIATGRCGQPRQSIIVSTRLR
jgi:hypothetical protein